MAEEKVFTKKDRPENIEGEFVIPEGFTEIGESAFSGCEGLTSIIIPDTVTKIGDFAFWWCTSLTSIVIPNSVTEIGESAFDCTRLVDIQVADTNPNYSSEGGVLYNKDMTKLILCPCNSDMSSYVVPKSVTAIGDKAFSSCNNLTSVVISDSVTEIGKSAFDGCKSLTSVVIPNSVTEIGSCAFSDCRSLTSVVIPNSVTTIGGATFNKCENLKTVEIYSPVISFNEFSGCRSLTSVVISDFVTEINSSAFTDCRSLKNISVSENNPNYSSSDGVLYNKDMTKLILCPCNSDMSSYVVPKSVTAIGDKAFSSCNNLTSVVISDSVTEIGGNAFYFCKNLTSIVIPNSVATIGYAAFASCTSLTSVAIPNSVIVIDDYAFDGCESLTLFEYPSTLKFKKKDVFGDMDTKKIKFEAKKSSIVVELNSVADLKGQVICVSGKFKDHSQEEMEALVTSNGATVSSSVTKKTTVLVTGDKVGATKLTKAQELGIKILSQEEFFNILNGGTNEVSAAKGKREVHVKFEGPSVHYRWNARSISREQLMAFISEHSDEQLDLDSDEGVARASEILNENIFDVGGAFDCYPDKCDFWPDDSMSLTVEDGDESLEFGADELGSVPVSAVGESKSQEEFIFITEVTAKYPAFEADIEIEGEFDVAKMSVVDNTQSWCGDTYHQQDVLYDGEDMYLSLSYDRVIEENIILKKN